MAGGMESSSLAPWKLAKPSTIYGTPTLFTRAPFSPESIGDPEMGVAADHVAHVYHISREDQDVFSFHSHQKALQAQAEDRFTHEIVRVSGKDLDEGPRTRLSMKRSEERRVGKECGY